MKAKLLLTAACLVLTAGTLSAQHTGFGIRGGYNLANLSISGNGSVSENHATSSFNIGAYLDLRLTSYFSVQPGLSLSGKGAKYVLGDRESATWTEVRTKPLYLELPVNAVLKLPLGGKKNLFVGAGPYVAVGVGGKNTIDGKLAGVSFDDKDDINWGSSTVNGNGYRGNLKRYDLGLNFLAGVQVGALTFNAQYGLGFTDIRAGADNSDNDRFKNRVLSLNVGLLF